MSDFLGLGDNDIADLDRQKRNERRRNNPHNEPEVQLELWTLARVYRDGCEVNRVVYGCVTRCLVQDIVVGEIVCSDPIIPTPEHAGRRIYVTKNLRYECLKEGNEISIDENELKLRLSGSNCP